MGKKPKHRGWVFTAWLQKEFFFKKFDSPFVLAVMGLLALFTGLMVALDLFVLPVALAGAIIGTLFVYVCIFFPYQGYYLVSTFSVFIFYPNHLIGYDALPLSPLFDILMFFVFIGTLLKKNSEKSLALFKTLVTIGIILQCVEWVVQAFNPNLPALTVWYTNVRRWITLMIVYVVAYRLIDTPQKFRFFIRYWLIIAFVIALYGCFQQWFGFLPSELRWINSTPGTWELLFQGGQLRKFSFLPDVVTFGVLCGTMAVFTLIIAINIKDKRKKALLFLGVIIMLLGMAYSGTRTTSIILPAGIVMYAFLTIRSKTTLITLFATVMLVMFILFAPIYNNATINRVRSSFDSKDESLNLRDRNRHLIQPYIYAHPIGGGSGTTNANGGKYFPDHPLANFPSDSALLRNALENGWTGLLTWLIFCLFVMYQVINYYYKVKNPQYKIYLAALASTYFPFIVTQYSQETIGQIPGAVFFYSSLSLMLRLVQFDQSEQSAALDSTPNISY